MAEGKMCWAEVMDEMCHLISGRNEWFRVVVAHP